MSSERVIRASRMRGRVSRRRVLLLLTIILADKVSALSRAAQALLRKSAQMGRYGLEWLRCDMVAWA